MFMFMATQELPGRGKRDLRIALAQHDVDLAKGKAKKLQTDTEIKLQEAMGPDTYHGGEFKPNLGAYPATPSLPYPARPEPKLSPAASILARSPMT